MGLDITLVIGGQEVPGRLPYMPTRYTLRGAMHDAVGMQVNAAGDDWVRTPDGIPVCDTDADAIMTVHVAALGVCWRGEALDVAPLRRHDGVLEYGTAVWEALARRGHGVDAILEAGRHAYLQVEQSIPMEEEVQAEIAPFADREARSTSSTSASA